MKSMNRKKRKNKMEQGWRFFECYCCGKTWKEACRDHSTQSGSVCPSCHEVTSPKYSEADTMIPIDEFGNLKSYYHDGEF